MSTENEHKILKCYCVGKGINIGCGQMPIPEALNLDIDPKAKGEIYANATSLPFYPETMDFVVSCHCLEHIPVAPLLVIREWLRVLKIGGILAFIIPDGDDGIASMGSTPGEFIKYRHVHCFSKQTMSNLLRYAGCSIKISKRIERHEWTTHTLLFVCEKEKRTNIEVNPESVLARYSWGKQAFKTMRFRNKIVCKIRSWLR